MNRSIVRSCSRSFARAMGAAWVLLMAVALNGRAEIPQMTWSDPEVVQDGVSQLSSGSGASCLHAPTWQPWNGADEWHLVYARSGEIFHQMRTSDGWLAPEQLSDDPADSRNPKLAFCGGSLMVVWEDDRTGHAEIRCSVWDGTAWSEDAAGGSRPGPAA